MTQPGENRRYTAAHHLRALNDAGCNLFDGIILNSTRVSYQTGKRYATQYAESVLNDLQERLRVCPILTNLLAKDHVARHDSARLAQLLVTLAEKGWPAILGRG